MAFCTFSSEQEWNQRLADTAKQYPDFNEKVQKAIEEKIYSPAMEAAIRGYKDAGEIIYYLASHPDEAKRIAAMTPHQDGLPGIRYQELLATAHEELLGVR